MRILFLSILFLVLPHLVFAQSTIDTVNIDIDEIIVIGYETNRNILETPVSVATVNPQTINKLDASSLLIVWDEYHSWGCYGRTSYWKL